MFPYCNCGADKESEDLERLRDMEQRLNDWATELEEKSDRPGDVGKFIAAELRNRMKGNN